MRPKIQVARPNPRRVYVIQCASGCEHYFLYRTTDGRKTPIRSKTSHMPKMKDIPDNILAQMAHPCSLPKARFLDLVDCPMDRAAYEAALREQGKP
jgi:hypothetical protein